MRNKQVVELKFKQGFTFYGNKCGLVDTGLCVCVQQAATKGSDSLNSPALSNVTEAHQNRDMKQCFTDT